MSEDPGADGGSRRRPSLGEGESDGEQFLAHLRAAAEHIREANREINARPLRLGACYAAVGALADLTFRLPQAIHRLLRSTELLMVEDCFDDRGRDPGPTLIAFDQDVDAAAADLGICTSRLRTAHSTIGHVGMRTSHHGPAPLA